MYLYSSSFGPFISNVCISVNTGVCICMSHCCFLFRLSTTIMMLFFSSYRFPSTHFISAFFTIQHTYTVMIKFMSLGGWLSFINFSIVFL